MAPFDILATVGLLLALIGNATEAYVDRKSQELTELIGGAVDAGLRRSSARPFESASSSGSWQRSRLSSIAQTERDQAVSDRGALELSLEAAIEAARQSWIQPSAATAKQQEEGKASQKAVEDLEQERDNLYRQLGKEIARREAAEKGKAATAATLEEAGRERDELWRLWPTKFDSSKRKGKVRVEAVRDQREVKGLMLLAV
ncbi:MAG: hypothetical protein M1815_000810 [Lichina confinis]|nr:MAG: hypothetical protein M1815_000810 [Lichina confinis]